MGDAFNPYEPPSSDVVPESERAPSRQGADAPRLHRLAAIMIDTTIILALVIPLQLRLGVYNVRNLSLGNTLIWGGICFAIWFSVNGYFLKTGAQTLGKRLLRTQVVNASDGRPASLRKLVLLRFLPMSLAALIPTFGTIASLFDSVLIFRRDSRCLHDHIADTRVVKLGR